MTASSATIGVLAVSSGITFQSQYQASFTSSTGSGGAGAVVSTELAASGFHTLTSTSTTGATGAQIVHMVTAVGGAHVNFSINSVAAAGGSSSPWRIYTSSSAAWWDSTSIVVELSTIGAGFHAVALNSSRWLLIEGVGTVLAASS